MAAGALVKVVAESGSHPQVLWAFYENEADRIAERYGGLLEKLQPEAEWEKAVRGGLEIPKV